MAAKKRMPAPRQSTVVPPIAVSLEEAMTRLMKIKPPLKKKRTTRRDQT